MHTPQQIGELIANLNYDFNNFSMRSFIECVVNYRRRPIALCPLQLSYDISGVFIRTQDLDYLVYNASRNVLVQNHIILHEIAHALLGHVGIPKSSMNLTEPVYQFRFLFRGNFPVPEYSTEDERDAELFARIVGSLVIQHNLFERLIGSSVSDPDVVKFTHYLSK